MSKHIAFYRSRMVVSQFYGFACACCGKPIDKGDLLIECPDCGGVFCKECVEDESYENHKCEDQGYWEEEES